MQVKEIDTCRYICTADVNGVGVDVLQVCVIVQKNKVYVTKINYLWGVVMYFHFFNMRDYRCYDLSAFIYSQTIRKKSLYIFV